ncbi:hypothetical protein [Chromobacterium rhizoryzae]|uniref:hypothetical protein n=1 Tax=Chromobacterium rhizoryzae TaxID=1778675 RepID=UPI001D091E94|nr:hypothetical protein [Chromobacterium rhizoryzae]
MIDLLKPYLALIRATLIVAALVVAFAGGWHFSSLESEAGRLKLQNAAVAEALQLERRAASLGAVLAQGEQHRAVAREVRTQTVTKEIVRYVEREKARAAAGQPVVVLDADWVRGHDLAAAPPDLVDAGAVPAGGAGTATAGEALEAVSDNYDQCYRWRDQVIGWQSWWRVQPHDQEVPVLTKN